MTTLTLHVDDVFAETIRTYARTNGKSMSTAMRDLLSLSLDFSSSLRHCKRNGLSKYWGAMPCTEADAERFKKNTAAFSEIEEDLWK